MTTLAERTRPKSGGAPFVPGQPQVNLLPPEIKASRGLKILKQWLALVVVIVIGLCAGGWVLAFLDKGKASDELTSAQDETARLQAEQQQYAEVPLVLGQLELTRQARELGMSTEVLWAGYYSAISAVLPAGASIDNLAVTQATPMTLPPAPASPLEAASIGQVQFAARSLTIPNTAAWVDALNSVPGFADAWVSSAAISEDAESGTIYYTVSASAQVNADAYALRFIPSDEATAGPTAEPTEGGN